MSQSVAQELGRRIKALRQAQGMTQAQLAEASGYDSITISRFERGEYAPGLDSLVEIAKILGTTIEAFFQSPLNGGLSNKELRHRICDLAYSIDDPEKLQAILKAIQKHISR